ncbi:hypothetical protein BDE02_08G123700 [Populus trichocarpa]|nr:hypothetical protein BDE02_08G123700 [Populus trichocarpa]
MAREVESYFCISGATFFMEYSTWGTYKLLVEGRGKCLFHLIGPAFEVGNSGHGNAAGNIIEGILLCP